MTCVPSDQLDRDQHKCRNYGSTQNSCHAICRQVSMRMPAQTVAVTVAMLVGGVIVAVGMDVHV